ncbi:aldo/keto reductase family domain-containing protein [Rhizoctonia solani AG-1 IA]|uniref:Aldo/keto reductase family domain-containing protein n=1 Tax=Thanatephorus cucumeris (strain AG1-IA) TaxID=983506 RepID=L8X9L7_THACA|nr:aldo/keto reductase family domain-containing protein [Rhizoctonia solani AG-1 IA]
MGAYMYSTIENDVEETHLKELRHVAGIEKYLFRVSSAQLRNRQPRQPPSTMPIHTSVTLNTGAEMPTIGLGTWKSAPGDVGKAVEYALKEAGYRHIDTALVYYDYTRSINQVDIWRCRYDYRNEAEVGQGIKASGVPRSEPAPMKDGEWLPALTLSVVAHLCLGKADKSLDWLDAWKQMEKIYETQRDKVKAIGIPIAGVSNFSVEFLQRLLKEAKFVPAVNQIELHPQVPANSPIMTPIVLTDPVNGIALTAYSPLGSDNSPLLTDPAVTKIAEAHGVHPARILVSLWANTNGVAGEYMSRPPSASLLISVAAQSVLPKSIKPARIAENNKVVELAPEEIAELLKIEQRSKFRACKPTWTGWGTLGFPDVKE